MLKKLVASLALAALALAPIASAAAQVSLNLNSPQADGFNSGSIAATANTAYTLPLNGGQNDVGFTMAGLTASGATLVLEGSNDGGQTWAPLSVAIGATGILTSTFTADGMFSANVAGRTTIRLRVSVAGTGNITVISNTSVALGDVGLRKPLPPGANIIGAVTSSVFFNGATGTASALAAAGTYAGPARDSGVAAGTMHPFSYFNSFFLADQAGNAYVDCSNDGTTWYVCSTTALTVGTPVFISVPVLTRYFRNRVVNGSTAEGSLYVNGGFTGG